jgi:hypothetical protein
MAVMCSCDPPIGGTGPERCPDCNWPLFCLKCQGYRGCRRQLQGWGTSSAQRGPGNDGESGTPSASRNP